MKNHEKRIELLNQALKMDGDFQSAIKELSHYDWDYDGAPAILDQAIIKNILTRYVTGQLSTATVYEWADFIELREDVDYSQDGEDIIANILHMLANPDIEGELTVQRAESFIQQL
jgi:hypothetical protein